MAEAACYKANLVVRLTMVWIACMFLCDCAVVNWVGGRQSVNIKEDDFDHLRAGNLLAVRDGYESRRSDLSNQELAILCDIYVQHVAISQAMACLAELEQRPGSMGNQKTADAIKGKRALVSFLQGNYSAAAAASDGLTSDGGRYIHALAMLKLGDPSAATTTAEEWRLSYRPAQVLLAANLYLATGDYPAVLAILQEPERRLDRDYSLSGGKDIFGAQIDSAPLRVDMFNEFGFGLLDAYSYAPRGNVYVEYALAKAELETGDREAARRRYETILAFPWIDAYRDVRWRALADRARIAEEGGDRDQAVADYEQAIDVIESARASITTDAGRIGFVGDKQDVYGRLIKLLIASGHPAEAFEYSERSRARALVDLLASVEEFGPRNMPKAEQDAAIRDYERAAIVLAQTKEMDPEQVASGTRGLSAAGRRFASSVSWQVASLVAVIPKELPELGSSLLPDEALLSYTKYGKEWGLFLITRGEGLKYIALPDANIDEEVQNLRRLIREAKSNSEYKNLAQHLYSVLIASAEKIAPRNSLPENLTITPFGSLHYLPFAALIAPDGRYLVDAHAISVLPNAEIRRYLTTGYGAAASAPALVLGNPERVGENGDVGVQPLPWAEAEAVMVAKAHRSSQLLVREHATKARFLDLAPRYPILHIAAHGVYDPVDPLQSRLLLAPDSTNGDLTVEGLFASVEQPWRAQVAVLSACNTAIGAVSPGEDVVGLERGFLYAGVDSLVGTLWSIPDDPGTLQVVEQFYAALDRGESGAQALRSAQRAMIRSSQYFEPVHWAAFTFTGLHTRDGGPRSRPEGVTTMLRLEPHLTAQGAAAG